MAPHTSPLLGHLTVYIYTCMHSCMHACMHGWTEGWMDGRTEGWRDGWMDGRMSVCVCVLNMPPILFCYIARKYLYIRYGTWITLPPMCPSAYNWRRFTDKSPDQGGHLDRMQDCSQEDIHHDAEPKPNTSQTLQLITPHHHCCHRGFLAEGGATPASCRPLDSNVGA